MTPEGRQAGRRPPHAVAIATLTVATAVVIGACGQAPASAPAALPAGLPATHPLLIVDEGGGLPGFMQLEVPRILTLTADGTLVTADRTGPGIVPRMTATRLTPADLAAAWEDATSAGLREDAELTIPDLYDAGWTWIRVDDGTRSTRLSIYALGVEGNDPGAVIAGVSDTDMAVRRRVGAALATIAARGPRTEAYLAPQALLVVGPAEDPEAFDIEIEWTPRVDLDAAGIAIDHPNWRRCAVLAGDDAAAVLEFATTLPPFVGVNRDGRVYQVGVRPLMPDEVGRIGCREVLGVG